MPKPKKSKLPKRIGGVKLPKEMRKAGGKLVEAVNSPAGRELIAAGLSMAAAAAGAMVEKERAKRRAGAATPAEGEAAKTAKPAAPTPPTASNDPHEFGAALGKMAEAALAGLFKPKRS